MSEVLILCINMPYFDNFVVQWYPILQTGKGAQQKRSSDQQTSHLQLVCSMCRTVPGTCISKDGAGYQEIQYSEHG